MARKQFQQMADNLDENGLLEYGKVISTRILEQLIGIPYDSLSWEWRGPFLELKMAIEEKGFFCTQRNESSSDLRIIALDMMPKKVESVMGNILNRQKRVMKTMKNAKIELLEQEKQAEHLNSITRMAMLVNSSKSPLASVDY